MMNASMKKTSVAVKLRVKPAVSMIAAAYRRDHKLACDLEKMYTKRTLRPSHNATTRISTRASASAMESKPMTMIVE